MWRRKVMLLSLERVYMMGMVHVEVLSAFAEVLGMPGKSEEVLTEHDGGGNQTVRAFLARLTARYQYFGDMSSIVILRN